MSFYYTNSNISDITSGGYHNIQYHLCYPRCIYLTYFQRQFGERGDAPNPPRNDTIVTGVSSTFRQVKGSADYLSLRLRSEDIHNLVHHWVGGNMLRMTSPNDPVFFMHHDAIDRMWSIWQRKVAASGTPFYQQSRHTTQ